MALTIAAHRVSDGMNKTVRVRQGVMDEILTAARGEPEQEVCGLLAGSGSLISIAFPAHNAVRSSTAFEIAPQELFALFRRIRSANLEHLGIYHSHPRGDNAPSPRDIASAFYPDATHFIISPQASAARPIRAFRIRDGEVSELTIETIP